MMKKLVTISLFCVTLFASVQTVPNSFSLSERKSLLKELKGSFSSIHDSKIYDLKDGWNKLTTPKDGVNVIKTFGDTSIVKFVAAYEELTQTWAMLTFERIKDDGGILLLKYLEPKVTFFVLANKNAKVRIVSNSVGGECKKLISSAKYDFMTNSTLDKKQTISKDKSISLKSRYNTHHERGIYNDTRVMLIYPKLYIKTSRSYNYGPANPKIALKFAREYEEKNFYVYDYKVQTCYKGIFPSMRIPPFPILEEIK